MAKKQASLARVKAIAGAILLPVGMLLFAANWDAVSARIHSSFPLPAGSLGAILEFSLAALRVTQVYLFDPSKFQSGLWQILVSFWPLILVIVGALLLQVAFSGRFAARTLGESSKREIAHE